MKISSDNIILRDPIETDVDNEIRWWTEETAWKQWETPDSIDAFPGVETYRKRALSYIRQPKEGHRWSFCIEADGKYIGIVNSYQLNEELKYCYEEDKPLGDCRWALGIFIYEPQDWSNGYGTKALTAFMDYLNADGCKDFYIQTYSANVRMLGLANKLGFQECKRITATQIVNGDVWDDVTLHLAL